MNIFIGSKSRWAIVSIGLLGLALVMSSMPAIAAQVCSDFNTYNPEWNGTDYGNQEHNGIFNRGRHQADWTGGWYCSYRDNGPPLHVCIPTVDTFANLVYGDVGNDVTSGRIHYEAMGAKTEHKSTRVGQDEPMGRLAVSWDATSCGIGDVNCKATTITFSTYNPVFGYHYGTTGFHLTDAYAATWHRLAQCEFEKITGNYSPIVIDKDGDNFYSNFSDWPQPAGVLWDFFGRGPGTEVQMAWTLAGKNVGFLWLDRTKDSLYACYLAKSLLGCNGTPNSGKELFGNITRQPPASGATDYYHPHVSTGFDALKVFDANHDGVIDANDAVYGQLRIWGDSNHNAVMDDGENYTLQQWGITSISVAYTESGDTDKYGNVRKYVGSLTGANYAIYDVFFVGQP